MNVVRMHTAINLNLVPVAWLTCSWQIKILISVKSSTIILYHFTQHSTTHFSKRQNNRTSHTS